MTNARGRMSDAPKFVQITGGRYTVYGLTASGEVWEYGTWRSDGQHWTGWMRLTEQFGPPPPPPPTPEQLAAAEVEALLAL